MGFTSENASEMGKKGAQKRNENLPKIKEERAQRKAMAETLNILLGKNMRGKQRIEPKTIEEYARRRGMNISSQDAILIAMIQRAVNGDVHAAEFIRDTLGEKQPEKELQMSYEEYVKNHKVKF